MAGSYRYLHYDVFTDHLFGGNQLAVFLDGRGLSTDAMQAIAHEMNFSETTFVLPSELKDTDFRLRIFTPASEMPMAGHPTIGSAYALARAGLLDPRRDRFVFGLNVGPTPVSLTWTGPDLTFAWMTQAPPVFAAPVAKPGAAARAIGLPEAAVTAVFPCRSCRVACRISSSRSRRGVRWTTRPSIKMRSTPFSGRSRRRRRGSFCFRPRPRATAPPCTVGCSRRDSA